MKLVIWWAGVIHLKNTDINAKWKNKARRNLVCVLNVPESYQDLDTATRGNLIKNVAFE